MELKDTKNLSALVEIGVEPVSEKNETNNHRVYDIIFPSKEDEAKPKIENKDTFKDHEKLNFSGVSTLDWLKTWRSLEEN